MMFINDRLIFGEGWILLWISDKVEYFEYKMSIIWGGI